jgi:DNA repair exonuclease SbcCD ATPase subunit
MNENISVRLMDAGTPETNGREFPMFPPNSYGEMFVVYSDFARKLERERDEAREKCSALGKAMSYSPESETLLKRFLQAIKERDEASKESEEQARLLGMSAEREESLRGKLFMLERELAKLKEAAKSVVEVWETPPWKIDATPSKAITQLRDAIGYED